MIINTPLPDQRAPGTCLVRMDVVGICGSDLRRGFRKDFGDSYPAPPGFPGHECAGTVVESLAEDFRAGDRVLLHPSGLLGLQEYVAIRSERLARVPEAGELARWLMCEPLSTVLHSIDRSPALMGKRVAIVGQGPMGLIWTAVARRLGASHITVLDLDADRLEVARSIGADESAVVSEKAVEACPPDLWGGFDIVVEAAGEPDAIGLALRLARREGTLILFGTPEMESIEIDYWILRDKELSTVCTAPGQGNRIGEVMRRAVDLAHRGWIDLTWLPIENLPFAAAQEAFERADNRVGIKTVMDMHS